MRYLKVLTGILIVFSFSFVPITFAQIKIGQRVPDFVTSTLDGKRFALKESLRQPENRVLVLTFFATWCELCDEDLKFLQKLRDQYGDQGVRVFCVFTGRLSKVKAAKKYMDDLNINLPVLLDKKRVVSKRYKVPGLPCTYAVDREGFLRFRCMGGSEEVRRRFEKDLKNLLSILG